MVYSNTPLDNTFSIADLPDNTNFWASFITESGGGVFRFTLSKGSPLRRLFEMQEVYEAAKKIRG